MATSKPTVVPEWARTTGHLTTPTGAKQDLGWEYEEDPSSSIENWRTKYVGLWCKWISERFADGATSDDFKILHPGTGNTSVLFQSTKTTWSLGGKDYMELGVRDLNILADVGGGVNNGPALTWKIPDRSALDAGSWKQYQYQDTLRLASYAGGGALEHVYWILQYHASAPTLTFKDGLILQPTTDGNCKIGTDSIRFAQLYSDHIFETNSPYLWAKLSTSDITINDNTWTVITPNDNIQAAGLTVEATAGRLEALSGIPFGYEGWYKVDCALLVQASVAATDLSLAVYRNGSKIPDSQINTIHLPDTEPRLIPYTFLARLDAPTDYIELYGYHNKGLTAFVYVKIGSQLTAVCNRRVYP